MSAWAAEAPEKIKKTENFADPFYISNLKECINGFIYDHTPTLTMRKGERVRWYLFATTNFELHAPHWHGNTVVARHMRTDVTPLLPMDMLVADMVPDNPGTWLFHCHTTPPAGRHGRQVLGPGHGGGADGAVAAIAPAWDTQNE